MQFLCAFISVFIICQSEHMLCPKKDTGRSSVFWFDKDFVFHYGIVFYVYYALALFYMGAGLLHFFHHRKLYSTNQIISLVTFIGFCFFTTIFQMIFPRYIITGFMLSITILITFLSLENPDDYIDFENESHFQNNIHHCNEYIL